MNKEKKVLFVLMPEDFQDYEFLEPYTLLTTSGFIVDVAGLTSLDFTTGMFGHLQVPNKNLNTMSTHDLDAYAAIVIPGGSGSTTYLWGNMPLQKIIRHFHEKNKIVATICYACIIPVEAGILTGKQATVYPTDEAKKILAHYEVTFSNKGVVTLNDDKIITAQGPKFAKDFAHELLGMLEQKQPTTSIS